MNERNKKIDLNSAKFDEEKKSSLRPLSLNEFIGQQFIKSNLEAYIESSKKRKKNLDHIILYGPPGLGKTSLAHIISNEKNGRILNSVLIVVCFYIIGKLTEKNRNTYLLEKSLKNENIFDEINIQEYEPYKLY